MSESSYLIPEWGQQDAVLLAWPHAQSDWIAFLPAIESVYRELVSHISRNEHVILLCHDADLAESVRQKLSHWQITSDRIHLIVIPYNDTWLRDSGPLTVATKSGLMCCDFRFNGWGGKYDANLDDQICQALSKQALFQAGYLKFDLTLEGGSVDTDGQGTILTTRRCLLSETRNPGMQEQDYEQLFASVFASQRILWLANGVLEGDDTDGHVDMLARFCDNHTIAYCACEREDDSHYPSLSALQAELLALRTLDNQPYHLVPLPIPEPIYNMQGQRLPASYANFLVINKAVLVPVYGDSNDQRVLNSLQSCFPEREIIGINARVIIEQFGSLHCLTMQLPQGVLNLHDKK